MIDQETIAVYDKQADAYIKLVSSEKPDEALASFIGRIEPGGYVLDLGCGPAMASSIMRDAGLRVDPVDASREMVHLANSRYKIGARKAHFDDINSIDTYDGIWANFSLLHASADDFPRILLALHRALKPAGIFHLGMKTGTGSARDSLGRLYTYYSHGELSDYLGNAGFTIDAAVNGQARGLAGDIKPWLLLTCVASK